MLTRRGGASVALRGGLRAAAGSGGGPARAGWVECARLVAWQPRRGG